MLVSATSPVLVGTPPEIHIPVWKRGLAFDWTKVGAPLLLICLPRTRTAVVACAEPSASATPGTAFTAARVDEGRLAAVPVASWLSPKAALGLTTTDVFW